MSLTIMFVLIVIFAIAVVLIGKLKNFRVKHLEYSDKYYIEELTVLGWEKLLHGNSVMTFDSKESAEEYIKQIDY
jgi:hypothetical protein